jgi:hypothetical protein
MSTRRSFSRWKQVIPHIRVNQVPVPESSNPIPYPMKNVSQRRLVPLKSVPHRGYIKLELHSRDFVLIRTARKSSLKRVAINLIFIVLDPVSDPRPDLAFFCH